MERRKVDDDYIASWFRYEPVSLPAPKPKLSGAKAAARAMGRSKAVRG
jgi:hypothetical protein